MKGNKALGATGIRAVIADLRERLSVYRRFSVTVSIHLNAIDMVIALVEFGIDPVTRRAILPEEEGWFNAGKTLDQLYGNSQWNDLVDGYYLLVEYAEENSFFRPSK